MDNYYIEKNKDTKNALATIGLTLGIVAFFTGFILAVPGLICSLCSIYKRKYSSIGIAGIIINGLMIFLYIAFILFMIVYIILIIAASSNVYFDTSEVAKCFFSLIK